jgi:hypothetical protein
VRPVCERAEARRQRDIGKYPRRMGTFAARISSPARFSQRRCRHPCAIGVSTTACFSLCGGKAAKMGAGSIEGDCLRQHPPPARNSVYSSACYWVLRRRAFLPQSLKPPPVAVRTYGGGCHLNPLSPELGPRPTSRRVGFFSGLCGCQRGVSPRTGRPRRGAQRSTDGATRISPTFLVY